MAMRKVQVFLRADQKVALRSLAARTGHPQSDLIRAGVDLVIERACDVGMDWRAATRSVAGLWRDHTDIERVSRALRVAVKRRFARRDERV